MKPRTCIACVCKDYRDLFASDEAMAAALGISAQAIPDLVSGETRPTLDAMIEIQSALRKVAHAAERARLEHQHG